MNAAAVDTTRLPPAANRPVDFVRDIKPLFEQRCFSCHGPEKQRSGFRLDQKFGALQGGDNHAPNIRPGQSAESPLIHFVAGLVEDLVMPQKGERLTDGQISLLRAWIDQGASWPDTEGGTGDPRRKHWAFQPVSRPAPPKVVNERWPRNMIDRFILARLERERLSPSPEADRRTLIRRLSFDLLGLPPTPEEVDAFIQDPDPKAYEKLADRLLASPHYGERWARHWLDVVRFAESNGFETNLERPNAWPYRDYVIQAFNEDKPYDQFIREQLAGDAYGVDAATGFIVGGPWDKVKSPDPVLTAQQRADELNDMVSTTGSAFLGLTVGCARCHNHKFDPVSKTDYYSVAAVFAGVQHGERPIKPADHEARLERAEGLRKQLAPLELKLAAFDPLACPRGTIVIQNDDAKRASQLIKAAGPAKYPEGAARGKADYPGDAKELPNLGRGYLYWHNVSGKDVFAWLPQAQGRFRVWLSWGCGFKTHTEDARYVLDRDGDLVTTGDQTEIARVSHQTFADGTGDAPGQRQWSGFFDAGIHEFTSEAKLVLRGGTNDAYASADILVLQQEAEPGLPADRLHVGSALGDSAPLTPSLSPSEGERVPEGPVRGLSGSGQRSENIALNPPSPAPHPHLRLPVTRGRNIERFAPIEARFIRFSIFETTQLEPCIDELEVFTAGAEPRNVALASHGTKPAASSVYPNNPFHKLEHINDGLYGNSRSWISQERGKGWVQLEFPKLERIDRVVWSRDRDEVPRYNDRTPTNYQIEVSRNGQTWQLVASSGDRLPYNSTVPGGAIYSAEGLPALEAGQLATYLTQRKKLQAAIAKASAFPVAYAGRLVKPEETHRLYRGDPMQKRELVTPGGLSEFGSPLKLPATAPEQERRVALGKWIADPANPLTARVMVNRIWQHHFGEGIVSTPSDFGRNGAKPTHPELLDWLADEFVARHWSVKEIHRLLVTSSTYRQRSNGVMKPRNGGSIRHHSGNAAAVDSSNRLLWRFPARRLEAEPLRDAILAVSGNLDPKMGGPGFDLFEPNSNYVKVYQPRKEFGPETWRRMIYQSKPRMQLDDTFGAFDCPDAGQIAPRRTTSTTPLQALNLLNSAFILQQSEVFARRLERESSVGRQSQVERAFRLAFNRPPSKEESAAAVKLIDQHGLTVFCRALLNANEFIHVF